MSQPKLLATNARRGLAAYLRSVFVAVGASATLACGAAYAAGAFPPPNAQSAPPSLELDRIADLLQAVRSRDLGKLGFYAQHLRGHLLEDYPQFWFLQANLKSADAETIRAFLNQYPHSPLPQRLRGEWLKQIAQARDWNLFRAEYPALNGPDAELSCAAMQARLGSGDGEAGKEARVQWLSAKGSHDSCNELAEVLHASDAITPEDLWQKIRYLLANNFLTAARRANSLLPSAQALPEKALTAATQNPQRFLDKHPLDLKTRAGRELCLYALMRLARSDPEDAADAWSEKLDAFSEADRAYAWAIIGHRGALDHHPQALRWFKLAENAALTEEQAAWKARAALRALDWPELLVAIGGMSANQAQEPAWRYWKARALKHGNENAQANALFAELSKHVSFYGLLAAEELGSVIGAASEPWKPGETEVQELANHRGIQRALALHRLGLAEDARLEWNHALRGFEDKQLLTAAELARRADWYDRMISAADKTTSVHDLSLRYPVPYRDALESGARSQQLDEAWVFGLVRQESRFIADARSSAGAMGLMQLMPATARWVARRTGTQSVSNAQVQEVRTNAALGSYYLKHVLSELGHPVLATAAYNAGPSRAKRWMDSKALEGAIFAETIPFTETRDYVKKVMANAAVYAAQFGHKLLSLKQRLGTVPGRASDIAQTSGESAE